jgi:aminopeptidase N
VQEAELSVPAFVRLLVNGMGSEPSISALQALHQVASRTFLLLADPRWVRDGKQQLAEEATRLLRAAQPGSDHQLAWAQLLAWTATSPEQLGLLAGLLDSTAEVPGLIVDTDLRWSLLARLAATGRAGDAAIDAELSRDATDAGRRRAAACRAAIPDAEHKAAAWEQLAEREELGVEGVIAVGQGFVQPEHAELIAPYAQRYLEVLPEIWSSRDEHFRLLLGHVLFPYPVASAGVIDQIEEFLSASERDPGLARVVTECRDIAERALRSRALPA